MKNVATDPRNKFMISFRKRRHGMINKLIMYRSKEQEKNIEIKTFMFYPLIKDKSALADIYNRACWYFPKSELSSCEVIIPVANTLMGIPLEELKTPGGQARYINDENTNIKQVADGFNEYLAKAEKILLWDIKGMVHCNIINHYHKIVIVDKNYFSIIESLQFIASYHNTLSKDMQEKLRKDSESNYLHFLEKCKCYNKSYLFTTGPSIEKAFNFDYSDGIRIICNSLVKNQRLLEHIKPHILCFADPVFHGSPCLYASEFRKMMIDVVHKYGCFLFVPEVKAVLYRAHIPELKERLIGFQKDEKNAFIFPEENKLQIGRETSNILLIMIELAASASKFLHIIGADGRQSNENYFWKHNSSTQLTDLMESVYITHPSFFRDRVYTDYYDEHCKNLENLIRYGEKRGINYYALTKSYIPALRDRFIDVKSLSTSIK